MTHRPFAARLAALFVTALLALSTPGLAQDVTLRSADGGVELAGSLLGFDGEYYRVDTIYGPLTVAADGVRCEGPGCPDLNAFVAEARFTGAAEIAEVLLPALAETFAAERGLTLTRRIEDERRSVLVLSRPDGSDAARFTLTSGRSEDGFLALLNRDADFALTLREPTSVERLASQSADLGDMGLASRSRVIALDAIVAVTAPDAPVEEVSRPELADIFTGAVSNWSELGGPDAAIALHLPAPESGVAQAFSARVLTGETRPLAPVITRHETARGVAEAVARDPFAIGITTFSAIGNARALALSGPCGFALAPTPATLKAEDYPLTAPLFVYTPGRRMPRVVRDFLAFFETPAAERVIAASGYVSQSITESGLEAQGARLANAILAAGDEVGLGELQRLAGRMAGVTRLSSTFRFTGGSTTLDAQSQSAVSRLARDIERGRFDGRTLIFVGFSDGEGGASANLALARGRAEAVRRAVLEAAGATDPSRARFRVEAFGEALPMACDDTPEGRAVNRRVEVWLD